MKSNTLALNDPRGIKSIFKKPSMGDSSRRSDLNNSDVDNKSPTRLLRSATQAGNNLNPAGGSGSSRILDDSSPIRSSPAKNHYEQGSPLHPKMAGETQIELESATNIKNQGSSFTYLDESPLRKSK